MYQFGVIQHNEWKQKYQVWLESAEYRTGTNENAPVLLAQDAIDVLWFGAAQDAVDYCNSHNLTPVDTRTVYHVDGRVFWQ